MYFLALRVYQIRWFVTNFFTSLETKYIICDEAYNYAGVVIIDNDISHVQMVNILLLI